MSWHLSNPALVESERRTLAIKQPLMVLGVLPSGTYLCQEHLLRQEAVVAQGLFQVNIPNSDRHYDYQVAIVFPSNYPEQAPVLICTDPDLPVNPDRHIANTKQACLGVNAEIAIRWRTNPTLIKFLDDFALPFLAWQLYYETHSVPPSWGGRAHGKEGVYEFYAEMLGLPPSDRQVLNFFSLLTMINIPKGHLKCPCGSGRRLRACHGTSVWIARKKVPADIARQDEKLLSNYMSSPNNSQKQRS